MLCLGPLSSYGLQYASTQKASMIVEIVSLLSDQNPPACIEQWLKRAVAFPHPTPCFLIIYLGKVNQIFVTSSWMEVDLLKQIFL